MSNKLKRRLEVATELRNLSETDSVAGYLDKINRYSMGFQALKAVVGKGDLFENLADLIEPDTCVMSFVEEEMGRATFACSNCGNTVDNMALFGYKSQFCPYCGANIISVRRLTDLISPYGSRAGEVYEHNARHSDRECRHLNALLENVRGTRFCEYEEHKDAE